MTLQRLADQLVRQLAPLRFSKPITHVYNPLVYARAPHHKYLHLYGAKPREVVLLGMNPGPWGMAQTGVPFGEVSIVRDWLGIQERVDKPEREHPKRPIEGFDCPRSEVSGARLWGWARDAFHTPQRFFNKYFVANYCPLVFMEESGKNLTPDKLPAQEREPLLAICDDALRRAVETLQPKFVIGVGAFAETRARKALAKSHVTIGKILHPSPASPIANRGWAEQAQKQLAGYGLRPGR